jgi:large subunit ribosomal protein L6
MSRVGNAPIPIPSGVDVGISGSEVTVKGPRGSLSQVFRETMNISQDNGVLKVQRPSDEREDRAIHGLTRSLLANMVTGVTEGFAKTLDLVGVGYRVQQNGDDITLNVMYSHPVEIVAMPGITIEVEGNSRIHVRGIDKQKVGQVAAEIRSVRPPNVFTGKGVRYAGEQVRIKPGKSARRAI